MPVSALKGYNTDELLKVLFDYLQKSIAMQLKLIRKKKNAKEVPYDSVNGIDRKYSYMPDYAL